MKKLSLLFLLLLAGTLTYAQDYWKKVAAPVRKDLLCISFGDSKTGYIGGVDSTLLKTTDGGKTWTVLEHTLEYDMLSTAFLDLKFVTPDIGYAVLSNRDHPDANGRLFKTTDGGLTWSLPSTPIYTSACRLYFFDDKTGFLTGVSPFGGPTVHRMSFGLWLSKQYLGTGTSYVASAIDFFNKNIGIIGGDLGYVYRTFDGGVSWDTVKTNVDSSINAIRYLDENTIIAASSDMMSLLVSKDKGATWNFDGASATFFYPEMKAMALSSRDSLISVGYSRTTGKGFIYYFDPATSVRMDMAEAEQWLNHVTVRNDSIAYIVGDSGLILSNDRTGLSIATTSALPQQLNVYPNPSDGLFHTSLPVQHRVSVYDMSGSLVYENQQLNTTHTLDLTALPAGCYLLEARSADGNKVTSTLQLR